MKGETTAKNKRDAAVNLLLLKRQRFVIFSIRLCSLVVSDLYLETKGSRFEPGASYVQRWALWNNHPANV